MKFGASLPQYDRDADPGRYAEYARTAEDLGYHHVIAPDHVVGGDPEAGGYYTAARPLHEPLTLLSHLAGVTDDVRLVTSVLILPQRQTALVAKQAAEVDWLSGGRLRLGVGVGWNEIEYEALSVPFHTRGRRMDAQLPLLRQFWAGDLVEADDDFHEFDPAGINPAPVQQPIPLWIGGGADPVLRRIARDGDGWAMPGVELGKLAELRDTLSGYLDDEGRDLDDLALLGRLDASEGDPGDWVDSVREWVEFGATHLLVDPFGADAPSTDRLAEVVEAVEVSEVPVES